MRKIVLFILLATAVFCFKSKEKHHKSHKHTVLPSLIKGPIFKTKDQIAQIKESNKEADARYAADKEGKDPVDEESYIGFELLVAKRYKDEADFTKMNYRMETVRANHNAIWTMEASVKSISNIREATEELPEQSKSKILLIRETISNLETAA